MLKLVKRFVAQIRADTVETYQNKQIIQDTPREDVPYGEGNNQQKTFCYCEQGIAVECFILIAILISLFCSLSLPENNWLWAAAENISA